MRGAIPIERISGPRGILIVSMVWGFRPQLGRIFPVQNSFELVPYTQGVEKGLFR